MHRNALKDISRQSQQFPVLCFGLLIFLFTTTMPNQQGGKMQEPKIVLPKTIGLWTRPDSPQIINAKNIFDYMDGAGELYLGYRFDHLEAYEYEAQGEKNILVELYFMKTADDAFGLLSLDWGGEQVNLGQTVGENVPAKSSYWARALYGEGLLRLWSDTIYARIMAYQETPESKEVVLGLGRFLVKGRKHAPGPDLLESLPDSFPQDWMLNKNRTSFFRSHLVLNSLYYLSQENILDLDLSSEAIISTYEKKDSKGKRRIQFLLVRYSNLEQSSRALSHFHRAYLPEYPLPTKIFSVEDGWMGYKLKDKTITFIFECPDRETAETIMNKIEEDSIQKEEL